MLKIYYDTSDVLSFRTFISLSEAFDSIKLSKPAFGLNEPLFDDGHFYQEDNYVDTHMMLTDDIEIQVSLGGEEFSFVSRSRKKMTPFSSSRSIQNNGLFYSQLLNNIGHLLWLMIELNKKTNFKTIWLTGHDSQQKRLYKNLFSNKNIIKELEKNGYAVISTNKGVTLEKQ